MCSVKCVSVPKCDMKNCSRMCYVLECCQPATDSCHGVDFFFFFNAVKLPGTADENEPVWLNLVHLNDQLWRSC